MVNFKKNINTKKKFEKSYLNQLQKVQNSQEYMQNEMQINCIRKTLVENADIPETLIDWLVSSVKKNTILECDVKYKLIAK